MRNNILNFIIILVLSFSLACEEPLHSHEEEETTALYTCPMHPEIVQEEPGTCPICGMDLVLKKSGNAKAVNDPDDGKMIVSIDPVVQQNMGVRVEKIKKDKILREIRSFGRAEIPEENISVVNFRYSGWIEKIWVDKTGEFVKKGQKLFAIYSPEVFAAQNEYISALRNYGAENEITRSSELRLSLMDVPQWIISKIKEDKQPVRLITIPSPAEGFVHHKSVFNGSSVRQGENLYTIYNLNKIWVKAEIYSSDINWLKRGAKAGIDFGIPGTAVVDGKVSFIYPSLNEAVKTVTVRIELDNSKKLIKPGMTGTVVIHSVQAENRIIVPTEAIIDTGMRKTVFVMDSPGKFRMVEIITGLTGDNGVTEVTEGLKEGETVVLSGQFLLDSESQLKEAAEKFLHRKLHGNGEDHD